MGCAGDYILIRELSHNDLSVAAEVIRASFATVAAEFGLTEQNCPTHTSFITTVEKLGNEMDSGWLMFGLYDGEQLAGYASLSKEDSGIYKMRHLAVRPNCRHRGYGRRLVEYGKAKVREMGGNKITIGIIEAHTVLKNWYAANGFVHTGTKKIDHLPFTVGYMEWEDHTMLNITLKSGDIRQVPENTTADALCRGISMGLYKNACAAKIDSDVADLRTELTGDCTLEIVTFDEAAGKKAYWHTASHIMAQAVRRLFPGVKLAIGPSIDNGFYYDFDAPENFSVEDMAKIEAEMKKIIKEALPLERFTLPKDEALALVADEPYKYELIQALPDGEAISFYKQGDFTDLCAGPHLPDTGRIKAIKLLSVTGAYWRGDAKNKMLQRIYGTAFPKSADLEAYLVQLEEAKKRDHNKLGRELELFTTAELVGQGLPILLPKGARIIQILQRWVEDEEQKRGWQLTKTPMMAKSDLYKLSGHWDHYRDGMFVLGDPEAEGEVLAMRPMTCPFQYQAYLNRSRSYRDLPLRYNETSTLFRNESSGEMHGLIRVRQFTISEGHLICLPEQLDEEFRGCLELAIYMLKILGLYEDVSYQFSQWDPNDTEKYVGTPEQWDEAQSAMARILDHLEIPYKIAVGDAAFYGPKLDIQIRNVHGKEDTLITIQVDQMLAEKFGMEYTDRDGSKKNPYIIHRTSIGCYERTLALLIEKYAGAFPMWLAPEQARVMPISERQAERAEEIAAQLRAAGLRVESDLRNEKIGYKIREAQMQKVPYVLVIGDKEIEDGTVSVRARGGVDLGAMGIEVFLERALREVADKVLEG